MTAKRLRVRMKSRLNTTASPATWTTAMIPCGMCSTPNTPDEISTAAHHRPVTLRRYGNNSPRNQSSS